MRLDDSACRARMSAARVARLATVGDDGWPHLVPITFALDADVIVTAVDQKPKTTTQLRRLRNIEANPRVAVLSDHYTDDWTRLWWVRAAGRASVVADGTGHIAAVAALQAKYEQYRADPPGGPVIRVDVVTWSGWAFTG